MAQEFEYYEAYARKKIGSYKSLMNVPKEAHRQLEEIDGKFKEYSSRTQNRRFENCWTATHHKLSELETLTKWYRNFKRSYRDLFSELRRRVQAENEMEKEVENYRRQMSARFEAEVQERNKFNVRAIRYLPPALHPLLMMSPVRFDIFPTHNLSPLAGLSVFDEELFGRASLESAPLPMGAEGSPARLVKARTTTI